MHTLLLKKTFNQRGESWGASDGESKSPVLNGFAHLRVLRSLPADVVSTLAASSEHSSGKQDRRPFREQAPCREVGARQGWVGAAPGRPEEAAVKGPGAPAARMARVFIYGTLKRGQPNHKVLLDGANGRAAFQGRGRTVEPYPLVIAGEHNIPWLLNLPGQGRCVAGEIYVVDEQMLSFLDEFEGCPDMYQRTPVRVTVLEWEGRQGTPEEMPATDGTLQCFVYSTASYAPEWVRLPHHDNYDSRGEHGLPYNPRENR
uniref:Gamma-glutamylaminecyclotransferase n=2 Tax=Felis catus TaxID=9685 RepID=A0ABI7WN98_FELCA